MADCVGLPLMKCGGCVSPEAFVGSSALQCCPGLLIVPSEACPSDHFLNVLFCIEDVSVNSPSPS